MKYPPFVMLLSAFAAQMASAQGISSGGTVQEGVTSEGITYNGTGTVQDSAADGDITVIDLLKSDAEVKGGEQPDEVKAEGGKPQQ
jgi:hypothetical protein